MSPVIVSRAGIATAIAAAIAIGIAAAHRSSVAGRTGEADRRGGIRIHPLGSSNHPVDGGGLVPQICSAER
jgi:hypothetical protein